MGLRQGNLFFDVGKHQLKLFVGFQLVGDGLAGVVYRGVVFLSALLPDGGEACIGIFLGEVHGNLSGLHHLAFARIECHLLGRNFEVLADDVDDVLYGNLFDGVAHETVYDLFCHLYGDRFLVEQRLRHQRVHHTLQFADVISHITSNVFDHLFRETDAIVVQLLSDDRGASREISLLEISG